ncbi:MAG: hypothetical protein LBI87_09375 [Candidatus Accumulibacter sp.]|jgi:hypothetical protein|nr:hypothetical protein [Accumulibacter sp.]
MPEKEGVMDKLVFDALEQSRQDGKKILIVDVGGYFLAPLLRLGCADIKRIQARRG